MPNIGRPSRDCHTCRQRRIKCDLKRPACSQCLRKHVPCFGYREDIGIHFRVETASSFQFRDQRKRETLFKGLQPKKPEKASNLHTYLSGDMTIHFTRFSKPLSLRKPLVEPWDVHFFPLFMRNFKATRIPLTHIHDFIPRVFANVGPSSALYNACNALAWMFVTGKSLSLKATVNKEKAFGSAVMALRSDLKSLRQCKSDSTLLTIWLLGLYENCVIATTAWKLHNKINMDLINWRGPDQFSTPDGRDLFLILFNNVETQAYMAGREWKEIYTWILHFYKSCDPSEYPIVRACVFSHHCSRICGRIQALLDATDSSGILHSLPSILGEVDGVEKETYPLSHEKAITDHIVEPPSIPYTGPVNMNNTSYVFAEVMQSTFRMKLSYHVLKLLHYSPHLSIGVGFLPQQKIKHLKDRFIKEIITIANRCLNSLPPMYFKISPIQVEHAIAAHQGKSKPAEPSKVVNVFGDLEKDLNRKSTLIFKYKEYEIDVVRFDFGAE
ncbi:hypothetical protein BGW36DRAFT_345844 [Talaromyces proteolyticus]|uniref:Zn(2)-C6 fungal-type domain-containing protein n=1 Tax=Talaromyces proteolyticus TaxID=1131652 RepID=A0AAD4KPS8_9EURO|nr:uncharacterized protein BGW36DRAFT_345844 [Talaromyces proteolyticus]KAH8693948.1 hypothetical protein BGW36DRAFT_345844 [Talaromyces proteolyticus]